VIAKLTGVIDYIGDGGLIIDVNGVGYSVLASARTTENLPEVGHKACLWIEHIIRQDDQQLCGFFDQAERSCFRLLLTVQGVGVKSALSILSLFGPDRLCAVISQNDRISLTKADGVGAKIAGRIVLELKDKIFNVAASAGGSGILPGGVGSILMYDAPTDQAVQDALSALVSLGYSKSEANTALNQVLKEASSKGGDGDSSPANLIRLSLQKMSQRIIK